MKLIFAILAAVAWAEAPAARVPSENLVVIGQRHAAYGNLEQVAVVFGKDEVTLSLNSNFLSAPSTSARLGKFTAPLNERLATRRRELSGVAARLSTFEPNTAQAPGRSPHALAFVVDGEELSPDDAMGRELTFDLLTSIWRLAEWKPVDGASIEVTQPSKGAACAKVAGGLRCLVPDFGTAYLRVSPSPK